MRKVEMNVFETMEISHKEMLFMGTVGFTLRIPIFIEPCSFILIFFSIGIFYRMPTVKK